MSVEVLNPGLQTTIQAHPRTGLRHTGVPASGPADTLSPALANRLLGNALGTATLEITLSGASFKFTSPCNIAVTGGPAKLTINKHFVQANTVIAVSEGDILTIAPPSKGCRVYLAIHGGFKGETWLGSASTYLPAALGGFQGRALKAGDSLDLSPSSHSGLSMSPSAQSLPDNIHPYIGHSWMLRTMPGPDTARLSAASQSALFDSPFHLSARANRMGAELDGQTLTLDSDGRLPSAAVFPGTLQCPPSGKPFLLMADAQTTGGYPRIGQVIRADRHMLGQIRPRDRVQFLRCSPEEATHVLREKTKLLQAFLGDAFQLR